MTAAVQKWAPALVLWLTLAAGTTIAQGQPDFTVLVERYGSAVVSVNAETPVGGFGQMPIPEDSPFYDYFRRFFEIPPRGPQMRPEVSMGSGFIISSNGFVLTNAHVLEGAKTVTIGLKDRRELKARVVGVDRPTDIALLKVEADKLPVVQLGNSNQLKVGQWVLAIGSPFGLEHTATQGIISALGRSLPGDSYVPFIQTDAAVNPGNSGGPLFDLDGRVIGVNSQIYSNSGGYMGVSFAIPINVAMEVAEQLKTTGKVQRGWLGVLVQDVTPELARSFGLERAQGALVSRVLPEGPAGKAGIEVGDVITAYNGKAIERSSDLPPLVARTRPGERATLGIVRGGKSRDIRITVEQLPETPEAETPVQPPPGRLGITVGALPPPMAKEMQGVLVLGVGDGPAAQAGIREGDVIQRIDNTRVTSPEEFERLVEKLPAGKPIPVLIARGGDSYFVTLTLPPAP
ncbi:MAG: DegQ family serine endoprotease [Thiohalomonadaceae bacterium]